MRSCFFLFWVQQLVERGHDVVFVHDTPDLLQGLPLHFLWLPGIFHRPNKDIFGGVSKVDKLQKLGVVTGKLQQISPDGVGQERRYALFDDTVACQERQILRLYLSV